MSEASKHFPWMTIKREKPKQQTLDGKETVEEFLSRGGKIKVCDPLAMRFREGGKRTVEEMRKYYGSFSYERVKQKQAEKRERADAKS